MMPRHAMLQHGNLAMKAPPLRNPALRRCAVAAPACRQTRTFVRPSTAAPVGSRAAAIAPRRTFLTRQSSSNLSDELNVNKLYNQRRDYERNRTAFLAAGAIAGVISFVYTAWKLKKSIENDREREQKQQQQQQQQQRGVKCDAPPVPTETFKTEAGEKRKVVVHDEEGREIVPTGNSVVPAFPRILDITVPNQGGSGEAGRPGAGASPIADSISDRQGTEYTLVGLGMRSVTFIGIQVYLVGFYVATQDVAKLQHYLVKKINPLATTLIPSEKDALRNALRDATEGEQTWDALLRDAGCRSAFRITPVRDTDFHHLRDGFVRAITGRSQRDKALYGDEAFGAAMKEFKGLFNRGSVPKQKEMLLCRDLQGRLAVMYGGGSGSGGNKDLQVLGTVDDERISRLLWLNYLAGSKVASEGARQNIIEGVMEFVERPVGTVATQVL